MAAEATTIDGEIVEAPQESSKAIATVPVNGQPREENTTAKGKVDAIAEVTKTAYANASKLALTADETGKLQVQFPDAAFRSGAGGNASLIYIEHAHLRQRLNEVLGLGQWTLIQRNRWAEEFQTGKGKKGVRIYVEVMLMIRGCFVDEAIGDMPYYPSNDSSNYGDAVEGAKSAALRRLAKALGVGLQAWDKGWCEGWWKRNPGGKAAAQEPADFITTEQAAELTRLMMQLRLAKLAPADDAWLAWLSAATTETIRAVDYAKAEGDLRRRLKATEESKELAEWKAFLESEKSIDKINARLPEIKAMPEAAGKKVWTYVESTLLECGLVFDKKKKGFAPKEAINS